MTAAETQPLTFRVNLAAPLDLGGYKAQEGYAALRKALKELQPADVTRLVKESDLRGRGGPQGVAGVGGHGQVLQAAQCGDEPTQLRGRILNRSDFWESTPGCGRGVGHKVPSSGRPHAWSRSSVLVMVASSDSVLVIIAAP